MAKPASQQHLYEIHTAAQPPLVTAVLQADLIAELTRFRDFLLLNATNAAFEGYRRTCLMLAQQLADARPGRRDDRLQVELSRDEVEHPRRGIGDEIDRIAGAPGLYALRSLSCSLDVHTGTTFISLAPDTINNAVAPGTVNSAVASATVNSPVKPNATSSVSRHKERVRRHRFRRMHSFF